MVGFLREYRFALFALAAFVLLVATSVAVVPEGSQAVVLRMGKPVRVVNRFRPDSTDAPGGAGVILRIPLIEQIAWADRGLVPFVVERQAVRTADEKMLEVDANARLRIFDPVRAVRIAGSADKAVEQLQAMFAPALREELVRHDADKVLMPGIGDGAERLRATLDGKARVLGLQVVDVRIARAILPEAGVQAAYARMADLRSRLAVEIEEQGVHEAQLIMADAQAESARIMQDSAGRDPEFYDFFRAMRSYETIFANPANKERSTIFLGPDNSYLKQFNGK